MTDVNSAYFVTGYPKEEVYGIGVAGPSGEPPAPPEEERPPEEIPVDEENMVADIERNREEAEEVCNGSDETGNTDEKSSGKIENNSQILNQNSIENYLGQNLDVKA